MFHESHKGKGDPIGTMKERNGETHSQTNLDSSPPSGPDPANQPETPTRRELIERYAGYAMIAAPLLVFVSKARAIHSKP
jgi:hypothetical protein